MSKFSLYEAFTVVYREGSISAAASQLNKTSSAISKQIAQLETDLGVQLFERKIRKLTATPQATSFYPECIKIIEMVKMAENRLKDSTGLSGRIRISLSSSLVQSEVMKGLSEFGERYPAINMDIEVSETVEDLLENDIDVAFRLGKTGESSSLVAKPLVSTKPMLVATTEYLKTRGKLEELEDIKDCTLAIPPLKNLSKEVRRFIAKHKLISAFKTVHFIDDVTAIDEMVRSNHCIGFNLDFTLKKKLNSKELLPVLSNIEFPSKMLFMVFRKQPYELPSVKALKEYFNGIQFD